MAADATLPGQRWISPKELAELEGYTVRHLANFADQGMPSRPGRRGREYPWPAARDWIRDKQVREAVAEALAGVTPGANSPDAAKARLANAQAEKVEIEVARLKAETLGKAYWLRELESIGQRVGSTTLRLKGAFRARCKTLGLSGPQAEELLNEITDWLRDQLREAISEVDADTDPADPVDPPAQAA